jgi:hypothetical protein
MKKFKKQLLAVLTVICLVLVCEGCTRPHYSRSIVRSYGPDGTLLGTVVTEDVRQMDPTSRSLMDVLEDQTYTK